MATAVLIACDPIGNVSADNHCEEAAFAIAERILVCGGSQEEANAGYDALRHQYNCAPEKNAAPAEAAGFDSLYDCARQLRALPCGDSKSFNGNPTRWLEATTACPLVLSANANAQPGGTAGSGGQTSCDPGLTFCPAGCKDLQGDFKNCGSCGAVCGEPDTVKGTFPACVGGQCMGRVCFDARLDCDDDPATCETFAKDPNSCGGCGVVCPTENLPVGTTFECVHHQESAHSYRCEIRCAEGYQDCDNYTSNGCEADLTSTKTCGTCGNACPPDAGPPMNRVSACIKGKCEISCTPGFADCGGSSDTCETNTQTSVTHCGGCNQNCAGTCTMGMCQ